MGEPAGTHGERQRNVMFRMNANCFVFDRCYCSRLVFGCCFDSSDWKCPVFSLQEPCIPFLEPHNFAWEPHSCAWVLHNCAREARSFVLEAHSSEVRTSHYHYPDSYARIVQSISLPRHDTLDLRPSVFHTNQTVSDTMGSFWGWNFPDHRFASSLYSTDLSRGNSFVCCFRSV